MIKQVLNMSMKYQEKVEYDNVLFIMYAIPTIPNLVYIIMMIMRVTSTRTTFNNNNHDCITFLQKGLTSPMNNKRYNYNHALYYNMIIRSTKSKDDIPNINNNLLLQLRGGSKHTTTS